MTPPSEPGLDADAPRARRWRAITLGSLLLGYTGYYFCRSNLAVAGPLLMAADPDLDKATLGGVVSVGVGFYAIGKLVNGAWCDFVGGRRMFIAGMVVSALACAALGWAQGVVWLAVGWSLNRYAQSAGWGALVKTASRWFTPRALGTVMSVLALSYLFGDAVAKLALAEVVRAGGGFQEVFWASAAVLGALALVSLFTLKESPAAVGLPEPPARPGNLYGGADGGARPETLRALLAPLLRSPAFGLVCVMSFGLTVIRETFNFWTPTYLVEFAGVDDALAASLSAVFPFFGGLGILAAGIASDRLAGGRRGGVMVASLVPAVLGMLALAWIEPDGSPWVPTALVGLVGLCLIGPYAFLSGVVAVDLGGKAGSSTVAGVADSVGYFGSIASGWGVGALAQRVGWKGAFGALGALGALTVIAAVVYWRRYERRRSDAALTDA